MILICQFFIVNKKNTAQPVKSDSLKSLFFQTGCSTCSKLKIKIMNIKNNKMMTCYSMSCLFSYLNTVVTANYWIAFAVSKKRQQ